MFHHAMREEYLKPTPLKPYMTYADHFVWPIHVPRRWEPLITPHLSLWGNSRTRATFPTHKKSHNPHPQGERGKGVNMGTLHCRGVGGVPAKPGSYIYYTTRTSQRCSVMPRPRNAVGRPGSARSQMQRAAVGIFFLGGGWSGSQRKSKVEVWCWFLFDLKNDHVHVAINFFGAWFADDCLVKQDGKLNMLAG